MPCPFVEAGRAHLHQHFARPDDPGVDLLEAPVSAVPQAYWVIARFLRAGVGLAWA
jgi:hypothetical protein